MVTTRTATGPSAPRRGRATLRRPRVRPLPIVLVAGGLAALLVWLWRDFQRSHTSLEFVRADAPVPALELEFFPAQLAFTTPSPPPAIGRMSITGERASVGRDQVPGAAVVRYRGEGVGTGFLHVRLGEPMAPIPLRPPRAIAGRVGEPIAFWCFGWRCAGLRPVGGAVVTVMGGGEHGIDLGTATTDADGNFTVDGVDAGLDGLGLRVRAAGFALAHESLARFATTPAGRETPVVALARASTHAGHVRVPAGIDPTQLLVLARGLPGVQATPAADGAFALDHVPLGVEPRLLLLGLPATLAHRPARAALGAETLIEVVPGACVGGRVLHATTLQPLAGALVWCGDQDAVRADDDGRFDLSRQLPGDVRIEAQWEHVDQRRRRSQWRGGMRITLEPGATHAPIDILVSAN